MASHEARQPEPVEVADGVACVSVGDVLLGLWKEPAHPARIRQFTQWAEVFLRDQPGDIAACQFLLSSASPPTPEGFDAIRAGMKLVQPRARRLVVVPVGDSIWLGVVRSIIRLGTQLTRTSKLIKVAADKPEAFDLLGGAGTPRSPTRGELATAVERLYAALGLEAPPEGGKTSVPPGQGGRR